MAALGAAMDYLIGLWLVCTSNTANLQECLRVWEYLPAYVEDYIEFKRVPPYQREKDALKNVINL